MAARGYRTAGVLAAVPPYALSLPVARGVYAATARLCAPDGDTPFWPDFRFHRVGSSGNQSHMMATRAARHHVRLSNGGFKWSASVQPGPFS